MNVLFLQRLVCVIRVGQSPINRSSLLTSLLLPTDANVLSHNLNRLKDRTGKTAEGYSDYRKIIDRDDIDAVMIMTPDHWHTKVAVEAMLSGEDVYCEKPLTLTIEEGKLIEKVVKKPGRFAK